MGTSMKKKIRLILFLFLASSLITNVSAQEDNQKLGQTGMKFLGVSTDARISGMGDAITSVFGNSTAMLYNPAGMADIDRKLEFSIGNTKWIADINYIYASIAFQPFSENYGIFGFYFVAVDYGDFLSTIRFDNDDGFLEIGTYSPSAFTIGFSYAKMLSEKFAIGANIKYAEQSLGTGVVGFNDDGSYKEESFSTDVFSFDFGLIYKTGFKSLNIGMSIRNFAEEIQFIEEGFQLPLLFKLGVSMDVMDLFEMDTKQHSFLISIDASHPRDYPEQLFIGGEYTFLERFSLRAGYVSPTDEGGFSAGVGIQSDLGSTNLGIDYSYAPFGVFDNVHRFSVKFGY